MALHPHLSDLNRSHPSQTRHSVAVRPATNIALHVTNAIAFAEQLDLLKTPSTEEVYRYIGTCPAYGCVNGRYATIEPDTLVVILDLTHSLPDLVYVRPVAGAENWKDGLAVKRIDLSWI